MGDDNNNTDNEDSIYIPGLYRGKTDVIKIVVGGGWTDRDMLT